MSENENSKSTVKSGTDFEALRKEQAKGRKIERKNEITASNLAGTGKPQDRGSRVQHH